MSLREHILLRPYIYIGSVQVSRVDSLDNLQLNSDTQPVSEQLWVYEEDVGMVKREVTFVPGMYKLFDEILVNMADNKQWNDTKMDTIKIDIDPEENTISVMTNGKGIPVEMHNEENVYVPTIIFGHLSTKSNDDKELVTIGHNWFGAKLCNIFSTKFTVETADNEKNFQQTWSSNMSRTSEPVVKDLQGEEFTRVTFQPDLTRFGKEKLGSDMVAIFSRRAFDIAATLGGVNVYLNGKKIPVNSFKDYVRLFTNNRLDETGNTLKVIHDQCGAR